MNKAYILKNKFLSEKFHFHFATHKDDKYKSYLAQNITINKKIQLILCNSKRPEVKLFLASNPNIDEGIQTIIACFSKYETLVPKYDIYYWSKANLALNPGLNKKTQNILFNSPFKSRLSRNPKISRSIKIKLVSNDDVGTVKTFAFYTKEKFFQKILMNNKDYKILYELACNKNLHIFVAKKLFEKQNIFILNCLCNNSGITKKIKKQCAESIVKILSCNHLNKEMQRSLSQNASTNIRMLLAMNPYLLKETISKLSQDRSDLVKEKLLNNKSIPNL